jgi:hypothetical protein
VKLVYWGLFALWALSGVGLLLALTFFVIGCCTQGRRFAEREWFPTAFYLAAWVGFGAFMRFWHWL